MIHILKKVLKKIIFLILNLFGYKEYSSYLLFNAIKEDILNKDIPITKKIWSYKRGFLGFRAQVFEINNDNFLKYMPDFDYFKMHPINGKYGKWIDDKLTTKYILAPFDEFLPKYYFQIVDGELVKLMDCPKNISSDFSGLIHLLKEKGTIVLKLIAGSRGKGFYKLTYNDDQYFLNTDKIEQDLLQKHIESLDDYIITEYIFSHRIIRDLYEGTPNVVRIQLLRERDAKIFIAESHIKIGTKESGIYDHSTAGAIFVKVNIKTGQTSDAYKINKNKLESIQNHPDSKKPLKILLPNWSIIETQLQKISEYIPQLRYLGLDIIITEDSFKIIEINSLPALFFSSFFYPQFENEETKEFFGEIIKNDSRYFDRILRRLE